MQSDTECCVITFAALMFTVGQKFEVLGSVIPLHTVSVMDLFIFDSIDTMFSNSNEPVYYHVAIFISRNGPLGASAAKYLIAVVIVVKSPAIRRVGWCYSVLRNIWLALRKVS